MSDSTFTEVIGGNPNIYSDIGKYGPSPHTSSDITTIFKLNKIRQSEINRLNTLNHKYINSKLAIEWEMEKVWNKLRKAAIDKTKYNKFNSENDSNLNLFKASTYSTGYENILNSVKGTTILNKLGTHFDLNKFLTNFSNADFVLQPENIQMYDLATNRVKLQDLAKQISVIDSAIIRLNTLIELDNVVIEILDTKGSLPCGCDLICKLLQWILDLILSSVNALIKNIIDRILKGTMNEKIAYIIKFISQKLQCALDIAKIGDNIAEIKNRADSLKNSNSLNKMVDAAYCPAPQVDLTADEIPLYTGISNNTGEPTTVTYPDPSFGILSPLNTPESGNSLSNHGGDIVTDNIPTGRNIPTIYLNCLTGLKPHIDINFEPRSSYEFILVFKPSDYIVNAITTEVSQGNLTNEVPTVDENGNVIDTQAVKDKVQSLADIMKQAELKVKDALDAPVYIETDCNEIYSTPNDMKLCSSDNLIIDELVILDIESNPITDADFNTYGKLNTFYSDGTVLEYFPEDDHADINGYVNIKDSERYWKYSIPDTIITVNSPVITTSTITVENVGQVTETIQILTVYQYFRFPDLPILATFRNRVNSLSIRFLLDVLGKNETSLPGIYDPTVKYVDFVDLGSMQGDTNNTYNISETRLLFLAQELLNSNSITSDARAVSKESETAKDTLTDNCLLPKNQEKIVKVSESTTENITSLFEQSKKDLDKIFKIDVTSNPINENPISLPTLKYSIPLIVLDKDNNIMVQIVDQKIFLQFRSNTMVNSDPIIIDYTLIPEDVYMLAFKTNGITLNMNLITSNKKIYSASGLVPIDQILQPSIIGGNADGSSSFCGTIIDIIVSKSGNFPTEFYNRSVLGYIPRTADVLFDFSVSQGSRVFNTINRAGAKFIKNTNVLLDRFQNPIPDAAQKADLHGNILDNKFYQVFNGYVDNFFCKNNLENKDFTISLWLYKIIEIKKTRRHMILSDDLNQNYIYFDAIDNKLYMDFGGVQNLFLHLDEWTHIVLKHTLYTNRFVLTFQKMNDLETQAIAITANKQFSLMSIFAEYDYESKQYINEFNGLLSSISIFLTDIDTQMYNTLHEEQKILVKGMEDLI